MEIIKGQALINGKFISIDNQVKGIDIISPVNLKVIGQVPALSSRHIQEAFISARNSQKKWEKLSIKERINFLENWKQKIIDNIDNIANLMVKEIAKPFKAAVSEIKRTIQYFDDTIQEVNKLEVKFYSGEAYNLPNKWAVFQRVAKGVVLAIAPFNYPVNLALAKIVPALITGNTVVFKPASQSSLTGLFLAKLAFESNIPSGVFNAISGKGSEIGDISVTDPNVNVISFTGSSLVGKHLSSISKRVDLILELGGKDAAIVLDDCDLELTARKIILGAFNYSGQRCTAIKRVLVTNTTAKKLVPLLKEYTEKLTIGNPKDNCDITAVVDFNSIDNLKQMVNEALEKKAQLIIGNKWDKNLVYPTILDYVTQDMEIAWKEPFAPILPIIRVNSIEDAILINNSSNYGLQASIFTNNIDLAVNIAKELEVGSVNINDSSQRGPDNFPFLGIKDSGQGVQGIRETLLSMTRLKGIVFNWKNN